MKMPCERLVYQDIFNCNSRTIIHRDICKTDFYTISFEFYFFVRQREKENYLFKEFYRY
ncbi:hypothetical protein ALC60_05163 [Trachymyrmex zeteki]|uniref:Uncharacterized protein n=1 Tax=Mycetomoellerius zeteki TaxID=64791 RepID=A0A151X670_9HYME|nr:hypothetical protein ALC60_05163 [Trachymyrmex zeteki]